MTETPFSGRSFYFDASDKPGTMNNDADNATRESLGWLPTINEPLEHGATIRHSWDGAQKLCSTSPAPSASDPSPRTHFVDTATTHSEVDYGKRSVTGSLSRKSMFTNVDGQPISGSTFIHGAGTVGPNTTAGQNEELALRAASADAALAPRQKSRIKKHEGRWANLSFGLALINMV